MEKELQPDSMTTVTIKPDYPPSEAYSSEPPPLFQAYHRSQSSSVQVAKIIAVTIVIVSVVLGGFLLASAYVTANASCRQLEQELELLSEAADRFQAPLQPEALIREEPHHKKEETDSVAAADTQKNEVVDNSIDSSDDSDSSSDSSSGESEEEEDRTPIHFKLPLQLDFDDLAGALIEKNQKSRMNCVVEKKRAEQVVDHQPKTLNLPFGLNITTDPRYERVTGERMAIFCESGDLQNKQAPSEKDDEETIMIQPVMIPIPQTNFHTHMAQQMRPVPQPQQTFVHPLETMRAPPMIQQSNQLPPNPILRHIAQQIIAQTMMDAQKEQESAPQASSEEQQHRFVIPGRMVAQRIPLPEDLLTQLNRLPNRDMIVAVAEQEPEEESQETEENQQQLNNGEEEVRMIPQKLQMVPEQVQVVQQQRSSAQEMNGRQTYARALPIHIPVHMIQQEQPEVEAVAPEESRPHYVQPRSVRSVDALVPKSQKRVKRCSCDCAC